MAKKKFKCARCYSRARIIISLNDRIRKLKKEMADLKAEYELAWEEIGILRIRIAELKKELAAVGVKA